MMFRKINSYLALAATAFFIIHAALMCLLMGGAIPYRPQYSIAAFLLLILSAVHAVLSLFIFLRMKEENTGKEYWNRNQSTALQRVMSILLVLMMVVHVKNGAGLWGYQVVYVAIASVHIGISFPRAMLTAGAVGKESAYRRLQVFSAAVGIVITIWAAVSYGSYGMMGS